MRTLATMVKYRLSLFLAIGEVLQILWHFEILTWELMGKPKIEIYRKRLIVERNGWKFGTRATTVHICRVPWIHDSLNLVWGHSVHFAKLPIPWFSRRYSFNSFIRFQPNSIQSIIIRDNIGCYFLAICHKLKILWHFEMFVNTGACGAGNFKTLLILQFSSDVSQTLWGHWLSWWNTGYYFSCQSDKFLKFCVTLTF